MHLPFMTADRELDQQCKRKEKKATNKQYNWKSLTVEPISNHQKKDIR